MVGRHDKDVFFKMSFNEQMANLGGEIERMIRTSGKERPRDEWQTEYIHTINRLFRIIREDPKNKAVLREVEQAGREWRAYVEDEPDALSGDEIFAYWNQYLWAYCAELDVQPASYFLTRGQGGCQDTDEWIGIYDSLPKLRQAYEEAVKEQNQNQKWERIKIHVFHKITGKWSHDIPFERVFPPKEEPGHAEYKTVRYVVDNIDMFLFKQQCIRCRGYGDYVCDIDIRTPMSLRPADEIFPVKFKVKNNYEVFEVLGTWWGGWNACPDWHIMRDKAREWHDKYGAELKEISHDTLIFSCRKLSEEEADTLWQDICRFAPDSRDIVEEKEGQERLLEDREFILWWD